MKIRRVFYSAALPAAVVGIIGFVALGSAPTAPEFATCENPAPEIIPHEWADKHLAEGSEYNEALFSSEAQERVLAGPVVPIPGFTASTNEQVELIREGKLFVDRRGGVIELDSVDWATNDHNYVSTQLHGLAGVGTLLRTGDEIPADVLKALGTHAANWAHCAAHNRDINPRAWHEGTVIKRQSNLLHALNYRRQHGPIEHLDLTTLLYLIDANAVYLLDTPRVYRRGNHGIRQDMLLAATALSLPSHPRSDEMLRLAEKRLDSAAKEFFTESGIWSEHAPGYVQYALHLMGGVKRLHDASPDFDPKLFLHHYESSRDFLLTALLPDRTIPTVGRSGATGISRRIASADEIDEHLRSHARSVSFYPDYGHAIVRGDHPNGLYLLFVAAQNLPAGKRHADDLSLILYNQGRLWITEGGHETYEDSPMTRFLRTPLAHSTYVLDGEFIESDGKRKLLTRLTAAEEREEGYTLSGHTERFAEPATATREISVDHDFSSVRVTDTLAADDPREWEGRFQIPGDLTVSIDERTVVATDPETGNEMVMAFRSHTPLSFTTCHGDKEPLCGWGQNANGFGPVTTLKWMAKGNTEIEIDIRFR